MKPGKLKSVILLHNINNLGKISTIVNVKKGYAKNYLIPRGLAFYATSDNINNFEKNKELMERQNSERYDLALKSQVILKDKSFIFVCNASDDGRLYGSISVKNITDKVNTEINSCNIKFTITPASVNIGHGIKFIGKHPANIALYDNVMCDIFIIACRSEADAQIYKEEKVNS